MPRTVKPYVVCLARTRIDSIGIQHWLDCLGVDPNARERILTREKTAAESLIEVAGRRCYMSFQPYLNPNVTKIRTDIVQYIDNLLQKRDGSVLEHVYFTFAIENVSRVFTGEMNRHRAGMAISEGSMRYIRYENIPYWIPTSIQKDETPYTRPQALTEYKSKEEASRVLFESVFLFVQAKLSQLQEIWKEELAPESTFHKKKELTSMMRRIIPMGVATGGIWTGNVRALRHICEMRTTEFAEEEILLVTTMILNEMREQEPSLFGDFNTDELGFSKPKYSKV